MVFKQRGLTDCVFNKKAKYSMVFLFFFILIVLVKVTRHPVMITHSTRIILIFFFYRLQTHQEHLIL